MDHHSLSPAHAALFALVAAFLILLACWGVAGVVLPSEWDGGYWGLKESTERGGWERGRVCDGQESGKAICKACSDFED